MSKPILCVYVAGAYSAPTTIETLNNIRRGVQWSKRVWLEGFAPFCPWADFLLALQLTEQEAEPLQVRDFYDCSEAWLYKADALFVTPGWENSIGTKKEIELARKLGIPVYYDLADIPHA